MSSAREQRRAAKDAARATKHAAKADRKRSVARENLWRLPADEPDSPQGRGLATCTCAKDCTLHAECLLCVAYHAGRDERPRCAR